MAIKKKYLERIRKNADRLFNAQFSLATGTQMLFVVRTDSKGNRRKPELITDAETIARFIDENEGVDGTLGDSDNEYFFMTTKLPDSRTITDMLDRALGKPDQKLLIGDDEPTENPYEALSVEELRKLAGK